MPLQGLQRQRDVVTGSVGKALFTLAWPATLESLLLNSAGLIHAYWMGKVSDTALSAVVMGTSLRMVLVSPMMGLSMGGLALVAHHIGAQEQEAADRAVMQSLILLVLFVLPLMAIGQIFAPTFLRWMGAEGELLHEATLYLRIVLGGLLFMEMLPSMNGVIRGAGYPEYTLGITAISVIILALLEPIFVLGLGPCRPLGVRGAALADLSAAIAGVIAQLVILARGLAGVRIRLIQMRPDSSMMRRILRIALPTAAQRFSPNLANALLLRLVASLGIEPLSAYSYVSRVAVFLGAPGFSIGGAAATMAGQSLGAGQIQRVERSTTAGSWTASGISLLLFGGFSLLARPILSAFGLYAETMAIALVIARYYVIAGTAQAFLTVLSSVLAAVGDAVAAMLVNIVALWGVQLPLAFFLAYPLGLGHEGVWIALGLGFMCGSAIIAVRFRRGSWQRTFV